MRALGFAFAGGLILFALVEGSGVGMVLCGALLGLGSERLVFDPRVVRGKRPPAGAMTGKVPGKAAWAILRLALRFSRELVLANLQQLRLVLAPRVQLRPRWLVYRTELQDPKLQVLLGILISLTPGTVTADLKSDRLLVHVLDSEDPEAVADRIRCRFEVILKELDR